MCEATKITAVARGVCLSPNYGMVVGAFEPFAAAASGTDWVEIETWEHKVEGGCEALLSVRFAVFSRLSTADVSADAALDELALRRGHNAASHGLLRARVSVTRRSAHASKIFLVGAGGIDVFGSSLRLTLLAPPGMTTPANAQYPLRPNGLGALEEAWSPVVGEDFAELRSRGVVHTYCANAVPAPVPPSAVRYTVMGPGNVSLSSGAHTVAAPSSGPVLGFQTITVDANAVVAWEVEP